MLLFYIRHGDPIYNPDSLTELGYEQANALVERMKICKPEKIFSSSSNRAILTAKPTADYFGIDIEILDWCNEGKAWWEFTHVNSKGNRLWYPQHDDIVELFNTEEVYNLGDDWWKHPKIENENTKTGLERIKRETDAFMKDLGYVRKGKGFVVENNTVERVALFAHAGFGLAFLSSLVNIPYPIFSTRFSLGLSNLTVIKFGNEGYTIPKILQLSNDSHIFASEKLKTIHNNKIEF